MNKNIFLSLTIIILMISIISSFGVSSPYWEENPLTIKKGETKIINLNLQNVVGEEDIRVKAEIIEGEEIVSLKEDAFIIKAGTSDTIIPLEITIPQDIKEENKTIKIDFKTIQDNTKGIAMGTGMSIAFDVIAIQEIKGKVNKKTSIALGISTVILAIIFWFILNSRKRNKK